MWPATPITVMPRLIGRVQVVVSLASISVPQRMWSNMLVLPEVPNRFITSIEAASRSHSGPSLRSARQGSSTGAGMRNVCSVVRSVSPGIQRSWVADWSGDSPLSRL
jgi:hypothetical protein